MTHTAYPDYFHPVGSLPLRLKKATSQHRRRRTSITSEPAPFVVKTPTPMFSRGPACVRNNRGLSSTFLDNIAVGADEHYEPLLFLYPRWLKSTRQHCKPISSITTSAVTRSVSRRRSEEPDLNPVRKCYYHPYQGGGGCLSRRWISSGTAAVDARSNGGNGNNNVTSNNNYRRQAIVHAKDNDNAGAAGDAIANVTEKTRQRPSTEPEGNASAQNSAPETTGSERSESLETTPKKKPFSIMEQLPEEDRRKLRYRLFLNKESRKLQPWKRRAREVHWKDLLELLEDLHKQPENTSAWNKPGMIHKVMHVPEETVVFLAGMTGMRENNWDVPVHNGCRVRVLDAAESEGLNRKVVLIGSERVVELVASRISQAQESQASGDPLVDIRKPSVPIVPSVEAMRLRGLPVPLFRGVWDENYELSERPTLSYPIELSHTVTGNVREFAEHVEDAINSKRHLRIGRKYDANSPESRHHDLRIEKTLVALFNNDANRKFISTGALNIALTFLCRNEFLISARAVFCKAEHLATVDTFNILLQSAARRQDLAKFRDFLADMGKLRIRPNSYTWLAFVDCVIFPPVKKDLVDRLLRNGYITHIRAHRSLAQLTVENNFVEHMESGQSVDTFIEKMRETQETNWVNSSSLNKMFRVVIKMKDFPALERLVEVSLQRGWAVDNATLRQILKLFRNNISWGLWYLFWFMRDTPLQLDGRTYETLFLIAFKLRKYNLSRVLWRYACMNGFVSYKMKQSVLVSLVRNEPHKKKDVISDLWSVAAGKVIVGLDLHLRDFRLPPSMLEPIPAEFHEHPLAYFHSGFKEVGNERDTQLQFGSDLVDRDIKMGFYYRPKQQLGFMLEAAAVLDESWKNTPRPTQWLVQNAVQVPVVKRTRSPDW